MNQQRIFRIGDQVETPVCIIALAGTFDGDVEDVGSSVNDGAGHLAEDGDLCVEVNDGTLIAYRIPDLSGKPGTVLVGEQSFDLANGRCFILTSDFEAVQLPHDDPKDAIASHNTGESN